MDTHVIFERASKQKICVVGDFILDIYIEGTVDRISPEAPVPVVKISRQWNNPGGAGNVVKNLQELGVDVDFFYQGGRKNTKTRVMSGGHHIVRIDEETEPIMEEWKEHSDMVSSLRNNHYDCVILSDYGKGMISNEIAGNTIELCRQRNIPIIVDSKDYFMKFAGATLVKCNEKEWDNYEIRNNKSLSELMITSDIDNFVITRGKNGLSFWDQDMRTTHVCGIEIAISDACGAGDTVTAVLGMMIALGQGMFDACMLANKAAAYVCGKPGVYAITKEDLLNL